MDDDKIIEQIFSIMSGQQHSNNLSEAEIKRIEKGTDELNSGKSVSHKELRNKINELFDKPYMS